MTTLPNNLSITGKGEEGRDELIITYHAIFIELVFKNESLR